MSGYDLWFVDRANRPSNEWANRYVKLVDDHRKNDADQNKPYRPTKPTKHLKWK